LALWVAVLLGAFALVAGAVALTTGTDEISPTPDVTRAQPPSKVPAAPEPIASEADPLRDRAISYLEDQDLDCSFAIDDHQIFVSVIDPSWAHVGWVDPSATPRCQGGTLAFHQTAAGWVVSAGFGHCPQAVDREFRERAGANAGC
jgi:hypothetical protein